MVSALAIFNNEVENEERNGRFNQYEHRSFIIKTSLVLKPYLGRNENDQSRFSTKQCHPDFVFTKSVLLSNICGDQLDTSARK